MTTEQEKSNIVSEQEFLSKLGFGAPPVQEQREPEKDFIDELEAGIKSTTESQNSPAETENTNQPTPEELEAEEKERLEKEASIKAEEDKKVKRFGVRDTIKTLIENNEWSDVAIKYGDKEYENIESLLAGETPTKELFDELSKIQLGLREKQIKENYVSIKDKDETKVKLINAILSDVDYEDLLQYNKTVVEPVKKLDFTKQDLKITENFVRQCLIDIEGVPQKYLNAEIEELKKDFKLIEKAEELQELVIQKFNEELDLRKQAEDALKAQQQEELASNMKSFRKTLKEKDFGDNFIKQAVNLRYSKDTDGKFHYEKLIADKMKESEDFASKFIHFILDENDFLNKEKSKAKTEAQTKLMEMVHVIPKDKGSKQTKDRSMSLSEADENFLNEINK